MDLHSSLRFCAVSNKTNVTNITVILQRYIYDCWYINIMMANRFSVHDQENKAYGFKYLSDSVYTNSDT